MADSYKPVLQTLIEINKSRKSATSSTSTTKSAPAIKTVRDILRPPEPIPTVQPEEKEAPLQIPKSFDKELKSSAVKAAKEATKLRKNILGIVKRLNVMESIIDGVNKILASNNTAQAKVIMIQSTIAAGGDAYKLAEAAMEEKATIGGAVKGVTDSIAKAVPGVAAFALALPLLFSPEVRSIVLSFFTGFLEGLGVSTETIESLGTYVKIAVGALTAVFTYKALSPVLTVFEKMQELAKVLGLAGEAVNDEKAQVDADKEKIDKEKKQVKDAKKGADKDLKKTRTEMKKGSKLSFLKRLGMLKNVLVPKLLNLAKNFVKALPIVGTVLGIGMILYDLFDIGRDVFNFMKGEEIEDKESSSEDTPDQETVEQESAPEIAATAKDSAHSEPPAKKEEAPPVAETATAAPPPEPPPSAAPTQPPAPATAVQQLSEEVNAKEVELKMTGGSSITVIDNSSTMIGVDDSSNMPPLSTIFSTTVGR